MRTLVVLDHPYTLTSSADVEHQRSFSAAVADAAIRGARSAGHEVDVIDLAADGFNPAMTADDLRAWRLQQVADPVVAGYQRRVLAANHLAFVFPIWWEAMPAATKGFLDKVLTKGIAYEEIEGARGNPFRNLMTELRGVSVQTVMTTPHPVYRWWFGDPVTKIMFRGTFGKIGVKNLRWHNYANVTAAGNERRAALLTSTEQRFAQLA
ncbi:NAD(P)H-dependent oxidoreductase [Gordonia sp. SL306]|uniref:NAD(P)H-dependent oxidoreductase n=1 Tax=Gordonia sp. SL306 TaxID=2995145 RepID=UPI00226E7105|nr:NAD(P)H-dependent oxidoreductase [Gordonia sp. SL306]WAC57295.1 NAD(P)H-dependent oxidoreductase [Gordonia sp. SL306]